MGQIGEEFAENFLEIIQEGKKPVEIVAVAHHHLDSPVALGFSQSGVPVYENGLDVIKLGEQVDIIFDLTGDAKMRQRLREGLREPGNRHPVIAPEVVAILFWRLFDYAAQLHGGFGGY